MQNNHYSFLSADRKMKKLNISSFFIIAFLLIGFTSFSQQNAETNTSLDFDGTEDYLTIEKTVYTLDPSSRALNFNFENGITIQAWVKIRSIKASIITSDLFSTVHEDVLGFNVVLYSDGRIIFSTKTASVSTQNNLFSTKALTTGRWTHIACTYDNSKMKIYINGVLSGEKTVTGVIENNENDISIGARNQVGARNQPTPIYFFDGAIDELRFYNKGLTKETINRDKDSELSTGTMPAMEIDGMIAYYKFNKGIAAGTNTMLNDEGGGVVENYYQSSTNSNGDIEAAEADGDPRRGTFHGFALTGSTSNYVEGFYVPLTIPKITSISYNSITTPLLTSTVRVANDVASISITGTAEAGNTVTLDREGMTATTNLATVADTDGNYTITGVSLALGNNNFKVIASKTGHTHPEESTTVLIVRRTPVPQSPVITAPTTPTKMTSITISGTADTNSYIRLSRTEGTFSVLNTTSSADGNWSITAVPLIEGDNTFTATAANSGNTADTQSPSSSAIMVTLDTQVPTAPAITKLVLRGGRTIVGADLSSTIETDEVSINTLSGTGEVGSTIQFFKGSFKFSETSTVDNSGNWSISRNEFLFDFGENRITVKAVDAAGNISPTSASSTITIIYDRTTSTTIISTTGGNGTFTNSATINYQVKFGTPVTGFTESDIDISGTANGGSPEVSNFDPKDDKATFIFDVVKGRSDGTVIVSIAADVATSTVAGNSAKNLASNTYTLTIDTQPPVITVSPTTKRIEKQTTNNAPSNFSYLEGVSADDAPVTITGAVNFNVTGDYTITYAVTDIAMNTSTATRVYTVEDTTPPTVSSLETESEEVNSQKINKIVITFDENITNNNISESSFTVTVGSSTPDVTGLAISGKKLTLTLDNNPIVRGSVISLSYDKQTTGINDVTGNELASFTNMPVTNNVNSAPTITGAPATTVDEDSEYTFTPTATDSDPVDSNLMFSITNKPDWATFSTTTGTLTGTPENSHVGTTTGIIITASDGTESASLSAFDLEVINTNDIATATGIPNSVAVVGERYSFIPIGEDVDVGDDINIRYEIISSSQPTWTTFSTRTGELTGTPTSSNVGTAKGIGLLIATRAPTTGSFETGLYNGSQIFRFDLEVVSTNSPPTITGTPNTTVVIDGSYSFTPVVADPDVADASELKLGIENKPDWATFNTATGELTGTPASSDVGTTANITISVKDRAGYTASLMFDLGVVSTNTAPTITGTPNTTVVVDGSYSFAPVVADPDVADASELRLNIENKPDWATFNTATGELTGTPASSDVGTTANITISVKDRAGYTASLVFDLEVVLANNAPTITGTPNTTVTVGESYSFTPTGEDADTGTTLAYAITNKPDWATFSTATGTLTGTPASSDVATTMGIVISVSDGTESASLSAFDLEVEDLEVEDLEVEDLEVEDLEVEDLEVESRLLLANESFEVAAGISTSPNPTGGILNVKNISEKTDYKLLNIRGQILKKGALVIGDNKINLSSLTKGVYFLNLNSTQGSVTKRIVKN